MQHFDEQQQRLYLAALHQLLYHFGWANNLIFDKLDARVPGTNDQYLMGQYGLLFDEVTAANLLKLDFAGNVLDDTKGTVVSAGHIANTAIFSARPDINCIIHTHSKNGIATSLLAEKLPLESQEAWFSAEGIGYYDFHGPELKLEDTLGLQAAIKQHKILILKNHGFLVTGTSIADAFWHYTCLEKASAAYLLALSTGKKINKVSSEIKQHTQQILVEYYDRGVGLQEDDVESLANVYFAAMLRKLDRLQSDCKK